jgi:anion-transporting  ArsA/GET3 family ATPase
MTSGAATTGLVEALTDRKVLLCLGSGGVGKTTTAAALAIALAMEGERVVVLTIDPARRLADALGRGGSLGNQPTKVDVDGVPGQLWAAMLDPGETFEAIIRAEAADADQAERILTNRLFINLTTSLSGTNEYMAAERLHQLASDDRFDRVIIDTPPSRHAFDFLDSPGRLTRFVDHRLYRSVFAANRSRLLRPLNAWAQLIMRLLARLVGSNLVDDVVDFFADFEGLDQGFRRRAAEVEALLAGPDTGHVLVTAPRRDRLDEARWILGNLAGRGRSLDAVVVNRVLPLDRAMAADALADAGYGPNDTPDEPLLINLRDLLTLADQEQGVIAEVEGTVGAELGANGSRPVTVTVPERSRPVAELDDLVDLARSL